MGPVASGALRVLTVVFNHRNGEKCGALVLQQGLSGTQRQKRDLMSTLDREEALNY